VAGPPNPCGSRRRPFYLNKETNVFWVPVIIVCGLFAFFLAQAPIMAGGKMAIIACVPAGGFLEFTGFAEVS
jgi:hypothetical protein